MRVPSCGVTNDEGKRRGLSLESRLQPVLSSARLKAGLQPRPLSSPSSLVTPQAGTLIRHSREAGHLPAFAATYLASTAFQLTTFHHASRYAARRFWYFR